MKYFRAITEISRCCITSLKRRNIIKQY